MGLYWIRPWSFPTLDSNSRTLIKNLGIPVPNEPPDGETYLSIADKLHEYFENPTSDYSSFPELSASAWMNNQIEQSTDSEDEEIDETPDHFDYSPYSVDHIIEDGCFSSQQEIEQILEQLKLKKNLVLQGPPGTGKTWLAKRLGYALMGEKNLPRMRVLQFHPNLSYEDFVRGWRPSSDGKLELIDGPILEAVETAKQDPTKPMLIVIEEINRGNPAQIFGELLTLLEADKRNPHEALELSYRRFPNERVHLPPNLYVIGTMNIADRSLALVDFALRRRFAFVELMPRIDSAWCSWVTEQCNIPEQIATRIGSNMATLNETIKNDSSLGPAFQVGHSYVTPRVGANIEDARQWFLQVVETEIGPLLDEYWFDALSKASEAKNTLKQGF
jgi:5-methylcytosine-specific restriction enzyme B